MASDLLKKVFALEEKCMPDAYVGSAYGAITLAFELARRDDAYRGGDVEAWFTAKGDNDTMKLDRFDFSPQIASVIMVEDVITTFKTTRNSIAALKEKAAATGAEILPYVLALVNRSGQSEIDGFKIISLIEVNNALSWDPGQNPFLGKEPEHVEPVRPQTKLGGSYSRVSRLEKKKRPGDIRGFFDFCTKRFSFLLLLAFQFLPTLRENKGLERLRPDAG